jgi:hypothetical protein
MTSQVNALKENKLHYNFMLLEWSLFNEVRLIILKDEEHKCNGLTSA